MELGLTGSMASGRWKTDERRNPGLFPALLPLMPHGALSGPMDARPTGPLEVLQRRI